MTKEILTKFFFGSALVLFYMVYLIPQSVWAIGPGTGGSKIKVDDEAHGPYVLLVVTSPLPVTTGKMSVWVRVKSAEDNALQRDAKVIIEAIPIDGGTTLTAEGSHKNAGNDFDYVAHVPVDQSGQWVVNVTVESSLGQAEVVFTELVSHGRNSYTLVALAMPFLVGAVMVGIYLWRKSAKE